MGANQILWLLTLLNLINYIDRWIIAAIIPSMQAELHMSNTVAGFVMSAFMVGYFLTSPIFGYLTVRFNRIFLITVGTSLWSCATVISGLGKSALQIFVSRTAVGVGEASLVSASPSLIADLFPPAKLNGAMALLTATIPVGSALGFVLGGVIEHHWGWRSAFFAAAIPGIMLIPLFYFFVKEPPRGKYDGPKEFKPGSAWADIRSLALNPVYRNTVLGYAAFTFTLGGFASWAPKYLVTVRHVDLQTADTWFGALTVITGFSGSLLGGWLGGRCLAKTKRGDLAFAVVTTLIAIPLSFGAFLVPNEKAFYILMGLAEFFLFMGQPAVNVVVIESVGPLLRGMAGALCIFVIHALGDFISPPLVGFCADVTNLQMGVLLLASALFFAFFFYLRSYRLATTSLIDSPSSLNI
jgi:MFS family permease